MSGKKAKNEISAFRAKYIDNNSYIFFQSLSIGAQTAEKMIGIFKQSRDFESPDGYYFDRESLTLHIFEQFVFDCSPRIGDGSSLKRNTKEATDAINEELKTSGETYSSVKAIVQGYSKQDEPTTFVLGENGDKYRDNYIVSFRKAYQDHVVKLDKYRENCQKEIGVIPQKVVISFLIEDVTKFGTYFLVGKDRGDPVILTCTKQFIDVFSNSTVDYVFFGREDDRCLFICDRSILDDNLEKYIDLHSKEFHIIPLAPLSTVVKKNKLY